MSLATLGPGPGSPQVVHAVVEIPKGSSNKYEFDKEHGVFVLDRALFSPLFYPYDYGWIPGTLAEDGDPIDVLVLLTYPTFPGCVVPARPLGALSMRDEKGPDVKILAACDCDPRFDDLQQLDDIPAHARLEIVHFFESYKQLEQKDVEVLGWQDRTFAHRSIREAVARYGVEARTE
jgi:inorganic pyrophosphatase